jgi:hypothetical protein
MIAANRCVTRSAAARIECTLGHDLQISCKCLLHKLRVLKKTKVGEEGWGYTKEAGTAGGREERLENKFSLQRRSSYDDSGWKSSF